MAEDTTRCRLQKAIPEDFTDLPEAVAQARERGMRAETPREAMLENRVEGVDGVRGEDVFGLAWRILSADRHDDVYLISLQPQGAGTMRVVDPCMLVTRQDAEAVLGARVRMVPPHYDETNTWSCIYQVGSSQRRSLRLKVDENPARNRKGYMQRLGRRRKAWAMWPMCSTRPAAPRNSMCW